MPNNNTVRYTAQEEFPDLTQHNNYMSRVLTLDLYKKLRSVQTISGFTINDAIQTGVDNPGDLTVVGCVAGDEESYKVFADLFDPIIEDKHNCFKKADSHKSDTDSSHLKGSTHLDPKYVLSCNIRARRNIRGICLLPHCSRAERRKVVKVACEALAKLNGNMKGKYFPLKDMPAEHQGQLDADDLIFDKPVSPLHLSSGFGRDWPDARGIWHNDEKNFLVWMNEQDHLRIISAQKDSNIKEAFDRWCTGLQLLEKLMKESEIEFMLNPHLGYITTCPSNLGTGLSASVRLKIPRTSKTTRFDEALKKLRLQKKEIDCSDTATVNGIFDISNVDRVGFTEVELVQMVVDGVEFLIECEKSLERGGNVDVELASLKQK